jgi:cysteine desulfurase/selenocysteine lyase
MNAPVPNTPYDVEAIRAQFPILAEKVYGRPLVYLDNAASSQKPRAVIDAMVTCMETGYANVHRGLHFMANAATEGFEGARETTRQFLNADSTDEIIFTRNATEAYNLVASSMGWAGLIGEGDEIILSIMEHHSNIVPWHFLRERRGAVIKWAPVDDAGNFLVEEYEKLFTPRTKMVAITHMSNVLGTVTPAREIVRIAHAHGVPVLLDGLLRLHRPQGLRPHRHRRPLRQEGMAGAAPPLPGRRRDDPHGQPGLGHLQRSAAPLRGRHARDRRGGGPRRRARIHDGRRARPDRRP